MERWREGARARDQLLLSLSDAGFPDFERALLSHQKESLRSDVTARERLETKRRVAEDILTGAFGRECTWEDFQRAVRRVERLGYTDVGTRVHVASLLAQCTGDFPEGIRWAQRLLDEAERRLNALRKTHVLRKEGLEEVRRIRRMTGWKTGSSRLAATARAPRSSRR
jgi:hypothetical protein